MSTQEKTQERGFSGEKRPLEHACLTVVLGGVMNIASPSLRRAVSRVIQSAIENTCDTSYVTHLNDYARMKWAPLGKAEYARAVLAGSIESLLADYQGIEGMQVREFFAAYGYRG